MKRHIITLAIIASAIFAVFVPSVAAAPKPQQPFINCQHTHFVDSWDSGWQIDTGLEVNQIARVETLRDTTSNSYCGQIRAHQSIQWESGATFCWYFFTRLWAGIPTSGQLISTTGIGLKCPSAGNFGIVSAGSVQTDDGINQADSTGLICASNNPNGSCVTVDTGWNIIS